MTTETVNTRSLRTATSCIVDCLIAWGINGREAIKTGTHLCKRVLYLVKPAEVPRRVMRRRYGKAIAQIRITTGLSIEGAATVVRILMQYFYPEHFAA